MLQKANFNFKDTHWLKVKGWKKTFSASGNQKRGGVEMLVSDETDFKSQTW